MKTTPRALLAALGLLAASYASAYEITGTVVSRFYSADRGGNEREGFYLITPDGTRERELLPPSEVFRQFGGFSPHGSRIAYSVTPEGSDTTSASRTRGTTSASSRTASRPTAA